MVYRSPALRLPEHGRRFRACADCIDIPAYQKKYQARDQRFRDRPDDYDHCMEPWYLDAGIRRRDIYPALSGYRACRFAEVHHVWPQRAQHVRALVLGRDPGVGGQLCRAAVQQGQT